MRVTETVSLGAGQYVVRELTVAEIRQWQAALATAADRPIDIVADTTFEIPLSDLALFIEGDVVDFDALTQSEIRALIDTARRLNPDFFSYRARLWAAGASTIAPSQP